MKFLETLFRSGRAAGSNHPRNTGAAITTQQEARDRADKAANVRGKHHLGWVPRLNELRSAGLEKEAEYLQLVLEVIEAAERSSAVHHLSPPDAYTKRACVIYRRRKDYSSEVALIERYDHACRAASSGRVGAGAELMKRLEEARGLRNCSS